MIRRAMTLALAATSASCASVDPRPPFADVQREVAGRTGYNTQWTRAEADARAVEARVKELLQNELSVGRAVEVALINNRLLQATYEEIGISQADVAQASRLPNPEVAGSWRHAAGIATANTELSILQDVLGLFLQPSRKKLAVVELERTKVRVTHEVLALAADVKSSYYNLQARQQLADRLRLILDVTSAAADFAQKQHAAGTLAELDLENHRASYEQSRVELAQAEASVRADRERLNRLLGLWGPDTEWTVVPHLPAIPEEEIAVEGLEKIAIAQRQDLQASRLSVELVGRALALKSKTRFFPVGVNVGVSTEKDIGEQRVTGPELVLQLPIFDSGKPSIARLQAEHRRAQRQLEAMAVNTRSEVREARDRMLAERTRALHYGQVLLPQRARILELTMRHYNMMLKGAYDLLLAKQAQVDTERAYVESWRDYWIARAELERALGGALPSAKEGSW